MNITLYYIPGINETDTPVFDTIEHQASFFADCERTVISSGFYPPFLRNTIKLDVADYNLVTSVWNYLSLEYNGKVFYYFVDRKRYLNEYLIEVDIVMDTIQTYMFDAQWIHSHIVRKTIKRWRLFSPGSPANINRDYIRENFGNGLFDNVYTHTIVNNDYKNWLFMARELDVPQLTAPQTIMDIEFDSPLSYKYKLYGALVVQPFYDGRAGVYINGTLQYTPVKVDTFMSKVLEDASIYEGFVIPFNAFRDISITESSGQYTYTMSDDESSYMVQAYGGADQMVVYNSITPRLNSATYDIGFTRNTDLTAAFDWHYVPALLDENYILFDFGNATTRSMYPLHCCPRATMKCYYWADISSGILYFDTLYSGDSIEQNKYYTIVSTKTPLSLETRTDAWKEYIARNRATLAGALLNTVKTGASLGLGDYINQPLSVGGVTSKDLDKDIEKRSWSEIDRISSGTRKNRGISLNASPSGLIDYGVNAANMLAKPDSIKTSGSYNEDYLGNNGYIYYQMVIVNNIAEAAYIYESTGYKVSEETTGNLFETNNRYYYDCVKTEDMNIELGSMDIERDFIGRWNAGLRLWHTTDGVLNCKSVAGVILNMGQVCIYDNVEV